MMFNMAWEDEHVKREWGTIPNEHLVRFVKRTWPDGCHGDALDIGCGAGAQSDFLTDSGFKVEGVDGSRSALNRLPAGITGVHADIMGVEYDHGTFDLVVDVCTLQHLPFDDARTVAANARAWLRPGGWLFSIMAAPGHMLNGDLPPRILLESEIVPMFSGYGVNYGRERADRPDGKTTSHWIIEAKKP